MQYQQFTPEMRKTHTILVPNMLPIHFRLLISIFGQFGYHMELLESSSRTVVEEGLKNVHNVTCYPALLVVGQFMEALFTAGTGRGDRRNQLQRHDLHP